MTRLFPNALLQWEDFAPGNGRRILEKYRDRICTFNDDMQGTGAITLAAAISAVRVCGTPLRNQRVVIFGAGTAGIGVADQIRDAMVREGLSKEDAARRFWCVDRQGLLTTDMAGQLRDYQATYARPAAESKGWKRDGNGNGVGLAEVVRRVKPTMLIGASTVSGQFHRSDRQGDGGAYRAAHHLRALQSAGAGRGQPGRSDRLDRRAGADRHRQPVRPGHL